MVYSACINPALERSHAGSASVAITRPLFKQACRQPRCLLGKSCRLGAAALPEAQTSVLDVVEGVSRRGQGGLSPEQLELFQTAIQELEAAKGVEDPTVCKSLLGRWKLLYTSTPGTESPIQRTFTGIDAFQVFQDIAEDESGLRVRNVVRLGDQVGALRVEAEASTDAQPMQGFVPRQSEGLAVFGKSSVTPPDSKNKRIDFWFDKAAFKFGWLPFKIPYPVPFRLLGDETKGWLDITYMDPTGTFRLSRGNKGTLFVLAKTERTTKQDLLDAISEGAGDEEIFALIDEMKKLNPTAAIATTEKPIGKWRVIWNKQGENANPIQKAFISFKVWQIVSEGRAENLVSIVPGLLKLRLKAATKPLSDIRTGVFVDDFAFEIPGKRFPLEIRSDMKETNYIEWLYLDDDLRITTGNKNSYFIHVREA